MSTVIVTVTGVVAPVVLGPSYSTVYGIDYGGFFGPAGASLAGLPFTVTWTGIDCDCPGTASFNPVIDAVLTINGHNYDWGSGLSAYNGFWDNLHQIRIGHMESFNGGLTYQTVFDGVMGTNYAGYGADQYPNPPGPGHDGMFQLHLSDYSSEWTQAYLTISDTAVSVPGPIVGAGLPAFILLAAFLAFACRRQARRAELICSDFSKLGVTVTRPSPEYQV